MPIMIDEQQMVDQNIFQYEERIKSPTMRQLDTTPMFITYYHIITDETTVDEGFLDVASMIGHRSPIRFSKIENFPIYGMDQIVLQLQDTDAGLDTSYEGEAIILPNTIKPVHNDYFIIPTLKDSYVFRVTDIQYDNIMPDNFYKINFKLEYIDSTELEELEKQKLDDYVCVLENIGTETKCIIEKNSFTKVREVEKMYDEIAESYKAMFYNKRYNSFLCEAGFHKFLYDPMLGDFINKHSLFNKKSNLEVLILTNQVDDEKRKLKYFKSIYRFIETKDMKRLSTFKYTLRPGMSIRESAFCGWHDKTVEVLDIPEVYPDDAYNILSEEFVDCIKFNAEPPTKHADLIQRYVRNEKLTINDIPMDLDEELVLLNDSLEVYFFTPIIMYIIREIIKNEISKEVKV